MKNEYVIVDIETTGLSRHRHKITEIAAIRIENFQVIKKFQTLINPQTPIPYFITSLTGITNSMVKNSPTIEEVMPKFTKFIKDAPFVAHCASFDHGFLNYNSQVHLSNEIKNQKICTMKLSRRVIPGLENYRLSNLCEHFKIENTGSHRAMLDAEATHKIFAKLLTLMKKQGIEKQEQVINFQDSKILRI